ncbi:MAG: transporter [Kordiimonas sp.]
MKHLLIGTLCAATILTSPSTAHEAYDNRIDNHAPIGVMADHFHKKGEFMASLRAMYMDMGGPRNPMMGPQSMDMKMGMLGIMYAPSDKLTLMGMLNYVDTSMEMKMMGNDTTMGTSNLGDFTLSAMVPLIHTHNKRLHVTLGASIPLGTTDDTNPMGARMALTMQTGTGSWGLKPSATYTQFFDGWSLGFQANASIWLEDNKHNERMGDQFELSSWAAVPISKQFGLSTRVSYTDRNAVSGSMMSNLTDERRAFWAHVGSNFKLGSHRFALEAGIPLWQDVSNNALDMGVSLTLGWQKSF